MLDLSNQIAAAVDHISPLMKQSPRVGMILGTGLGGLAEAIEDRVEISYSDIPHFGESTVESHQGKLICGKLSGVPMIAMAGRFHYYEGYSMQQVTFPVRVMKALGAEILIVTNAAGGMNPEFKLADVAIIEDHINLIGDNPLIGINDDNLGPRFPDMSEPYDQKLIAIAERAAEELGIATRRSVFVAVSGPNLETRAEYRMLRRIGADLVGMSTVPENIVAIHAGMRVLGFSIVTDVCLPNELEPVQIEKILEVAGRGGEKLERLLAKIFEQL